METDKWHTSRMPNRGVRISRLHETMGCVGRRPREQNPAVVCRRPTAWASGTVDLVVETIAKAVSNTRLFEAAFAWQLHPHKSLVGCTNPKRRNMLAAESGLPAATRIKYLGAIHEVGGARSNPATARANASVSRWTPISKLSLNPKYRRHLASAAATPAATYGAALGRPTKAVVTKCRRAATKACHGGTNRAAPEVALCMLGAHGGQTLGQYG